MLINVTIVTKAARFHYSYEYLTSIIWKTFPPYFDWYFDKILEY